MNDVRNCIKDNNLDSKVGYSFMQFDFVDPSRDLKCLFKCLAQVNGGIDESGNINKKNMIQLVTNFDPELTSKVSETSQRLRSLKFTFKLPGFGNFGNVLY